MNDPNEQDLTILIFGLNTDLPAVYFGNTEEHNGFIYRNQLRANPLYWEGRLLGELVYHPDVLAPNGYLGVYVYSFGPNRVPSFGTVALAHELLAASLPLLDNNLAYRPIWPRQREQYDLERTRYDDSRVNVLLEEDILRDVDFIPFNREEGYGFLRVMSLEERPNPRDVVIYEALPNELPRVAGIITTVPQTPLAHVNLRAVQDGRPQRLHPRRHRRRRHRRPDRQFRPLHGDRRRVLHPRRHPGGSRCALRRFPSRSDPDAGTRPHGDAGHPPWTTWISTTGTCSE